jgi:DMSO/TMAO reductase YedYZ molybdopterin-dependent catalytic subunit
MTASADDRPAVGRPAQPEFGFPVPLWRALAARRPPGPLFRPQLWRSPLRGPWLTSVFGAVLLVGLPIVIVTGLLSYLAYSPQYAGNAFPGATHGLHLPFFNWPTHPAWLYRLTQGLHVGVGLALIPVVLAKLWSVMPKLFAWPAVRSLAGVLERGSLFLLVGSILFELATGVLNTQYDYVFRFDFYTAHYYGAWVFIGAFITHVGFHLPTMWRSLRTRRLRTELRTPLAQTVPEPPDEFGLVAQSPSDPTISRRGLLAAVGGASVLLTLVTVGETAGDGLRWTALLSARGRSYGNGPGDFQVNRTARTAGINQTDTGPAWRLTVVGARTLELSREQLLAMPQHTARLPIACVEGWSTTQTWSGVRLADLMAAAGSPDPSHAVVLSLEKAGAFNRAVLTGGQLTTGDALLALKVNGVDLPPDHGYPARVVVPALPGVHNTKWVRRIEIDGPL